MGRKKKKKLQEFDEEIRLKWKKGKDSVKFWKKIKKKEVKEYEC